ncbi:unnamed protein product [Protopolystoma xenopodis]|uniref:Uncharacterized protein n=1 Tax=Protopolystoma xenopodis TaxID=117903 RepID=A0A3S5AKY6_9PLAT|nr:unnamed protein product [Protopolystoma xenopodis]
MMTSVASEPQPASIFEPIIKATTIDRHPTKQVNWHTEPTAQLPSIKINLTGGCIEQKASPPPRPMSPPALSPLDYQTFHQDDELAQPDHLRRAYTPMTSAAADPGLQNRRLQKPPRSPGLGWLQPATNDEAALELSDYENLGGPRIRVIHFLSLGFFPLVRTHLSVLDLE